MYGLVKRILGMCKLSRAGPLKYRLDFTKNTTVEWNESLKFITIDVFMSDLFKQLSKGLTVNLPIHDYLDVDEGYFKVVPIVKYDLRGKKFIEWNAYFLSHDVPNAKY